MSLVERGGQGSQEGDRIVVWTPQHRAGGVYPPLVTGTGLLFHDHLRSDYHFSQGQRWEH